MRVKPLIGELLGTCILCFIGCSSVALAVVFEIFSSIVPIAFIWGTGVTLAIYATKKYSNAHLNPAVSFGFFINHEINLKKLLSYWFAQLVGAVFAGLGVYLFFIREIKNFELINNIIPNDVSGARTASIFGEFFPNPGYIDKIHNLSELSACMYECIGTFILMTSILWFTKIKKTRKISPLLIGLTVVLLIIWIAPFTQCGINPARDLGPRLVAYYLHWGSGAFPSGQISFLTVYILSPLTGAWLSALLFKKVIKLID
tara:strand:- start:662 stop:1438 length:777 start_codon:yes stop_codon:yes gene_type:complete